MPFSRSKSLTSRGNVAMRSGRAITRPVLRRSELDADPAGTPSITMKAWSSVIAPMG